MTIAIIITCQLPPPPLLLLLLHGSTCPLSALRDLYINTCSQHAITPCRAALKPKLA